jgi:hypothetical protein
MNYEQVVNAVLRLLDEYSSRGVVTAPIKTADIRAKIPDAVNQICMDLATTTGKLAKEWQIINFPVLNDSSKDTSSIKNHLPGTDDYIATLTGARAYFVEVSGYYDIVIEESISGVWTELVELTPTAGSEPTTFVELKGLLTPSSLTNAVRMRCTGDYVFPYRNHILYPYTFPTASEVQQNRPFFLYDLPADWLKLNNVMIRKDTRQWTSFAEYKITDNKFAFNRYATGEILVNYWRKPTAIAVVDTNSPTVLELAQLIDTTPDARQIVPLGVAGTVMVSDDPSASAYFFNLYESRKYQLVQQDGSYGLSTIPSLTGW